MLNNSLNKARKARNDEFYTVWKDVEAEIEAYFAHNRTSLKIKQCYYHVTTLRGE